MENASKALLIAAGVLIGLILMTMILYSYSQISSYYKSKEQSETVKQLAEFNKQYNLYDRDDVRGSELLSLVNKIIDYNKQNPDDEQMQIVIKIPSPDSDTSVQYFYYSYEDYYSSSSVNTKFIGTVTFDQDTINNSGSLISKANEIENKHTQAICAKLVAHMSTLMGDNYQEVLKKLKIEEKYSTVLDVQNLRKDILMYYQYVYFKRAHFDCTDLTYVNRKSK